MLRDELVAYGAYDELLRLHRECYQAEDGSSPESTFWPWVQARESLFKSVIKDGLWHPRDLHDFALAQMPLKQNRIHGNLLFAAEKALTFLPTPADPLQGWEDLWSFASNFNRLPDTVKAELGPYTLVIKPL